MLYERRRRRQNKKPVRKGNLWEKVTFVCILETRRTPRLRPRPEQLSKNENNIIFLLFFTINLNVKSRLAKLSFLLLQNWLPINYCYFCGERNSLLKDITKPHSFIIIYWCQSNWCSYLRLSNSFIIIIIIIIIICITLFLIPLDYPKGKLNSILFKVHLKKFLCLSQRQTPFLQFVILEK